MTEEQEIKMLCDEYLRVQKIVADTHDMCIEDVLTITSLIMSVKLAKGMQQEAEDG